ncbi:hypothetical protein RCO24_00005, partial [Hyphomicrobium sp. LHD-15]|nr:hypothetical protein [Hyphomicrobium sp. LHD-15]
MVLVDGCRQRGGRPLCKSAQLVVTVFLAALAVAMIAVSPATAVTFNVTSTSDDGTPGTLRWAINQANAAGAGTHTIAIQAGLSSVALSGDLPALNNAGANITISGNGNTLSGEGDYRGLFVYSGQVRIEDLTIQNAAAKGGDVAQAAGGGGAGLGGALFVNSGATVTVSNVNLADNSAVGGNAGQFGYGGSGGGMGGNGGFNNGGGGGLGSGANGGTGSGNNGAPGIVADGAPGGDSAGGGTGGLSGGGGGSATGGLGAGGGGVGG